VRQKEEKGDLRKKISQLPVCSPGKKEEESSLLRSFSAVFVPVVRGIEENSGKKKREGKQKRGGACIIVVPVSRLGPCHKERERRKGGGELRILIKGLP